jgi:hypothetical protein
MGSIPRPAQVHRLAEAATDLMKSITPAKIEEWTHSDPVDWANESFAIAERPGTKYCVHQGASCELPSSAKVKIDAAYVEANTPIESGKAKATRELFGAD